MFTALIIVINVDRKWIILDYFRPIEPIVCTVRLMESYLITKSVDEGLDLSENFINAEVVFSIQRF